ncbi:LppU/SCO3897 family protein [Catenuloplanes japonicus]|uniref:LppU/SCO3897 family protein n=1 Tax=Catenuloplanes japonicus TaxID=33876 RepID=UPI0012F839AB|nr:hypothetical protein [Catenuloplanes japonicus]
MSNYGPPGGPPGRGRDPHEEPYTEPSDPWGDWGRDSNEAVPEQQQGYDQGGYDRGAYQQGYGGNQGYGAGNYDVTGTGYAQRPAEAAPGGWNPAPAPVAPPPRKSSAGIIALVAILVVLVLAGGGGAAYFLLNNDNGGNEATGDPTPPPSSSAAATPSATPAPSSTATVSDARNVKKGECVQNVGSDEKPSLKVAECDEKGVYEVLDRFDAPAAGQEDAQKKCADVEGYTNYYFFNSQLDSLDFVLCLKQR